jgi:hypothetical protein
MAGEKMDMWGVTLTTAGPMMRTEPDLQVLRSSPGLIRSVAGWFFNLPIAKNRLPPVFRQTMSETDPRLPEMAMGLGVVHGDTRRFYPMEPIRKGIIDEIAGRKLEIRIGDVDGVPHAVWPDGSRPIQLFTRWYGFSFTFRGCEIHGQKA